MKVVCTGKPFNETEKSMFKSWEMEDRFIHEFIKTDQEMLDLYHYALAFVYPSSYEGFGLPILEAYKAECPVLLNHASCFPEIAEDAAVYFHMDEKRTDFEEQFETFYYLDGIEKKKLIEKQNERLKHFSWKKSALELANIYKHIN
ncbi:glycosyltransferase [Segatella copri]|uniref:glycosyltransferase n=1 Tax=Segatella copri TaxID=165179 RepID=UPI001C00BE87|nr:glycosyltransferase [Segatella copri]MBT9636025.1 glycosyltransferase [Segatella copri]